MMARSTIGTTADTVITGIAAGGIRVTPIITARAVTAIGIAGIGGIVNIAGVGGKEVG
jgi:hypothetical protein